jgi:P27 family predicted phage terminase small subunit
MRGRKPLPSDIKRANGNPGKRQLNDGEPVYTVPTATPYAPRYLSAVAQREWGRAAALLMRARVLTEADLTALALYCDAYGRWIEARAKLADQGLVIEARAKLDENGLAIMDVKGSYQNPWLFVANKAHEQMLKLLAEFGMTPSSRTRIKAVEGSRQLSLAELLFESATGQDVMVGDEASDEGETAETTG